ncbi:hypothetical protein Hanom_Chr09g00805251 [Helianthus anomalus]
MGRSFFISFFERPSSLHFKRPSRAFILNNETYDSYIFIYLNIFRFVNRKSAKGRTYQLTFPLSVLISPLCPRTRIG